jgi:hypothetical protein
MALNISNFISTTLRAPISPASNVLQLAQGTGQLFAFSAGDYVYITLEDRLNREVVRYVSTGVVTGDNIAVFRAQDGTFARAFPAGTCVKVAWNEQQVKDLITELFGSLISNNCPPANSVLTNGVPIGAPPPCVFYAIDRNTDPWRLYFWDGDNWNLLGDGGNVYTGVGPIVVNPTTNVISLNLDPASGLVLLPNGQLTINCTTLYARCPPVAVPPTGVYTISYVNTDGSPTPNPITSASINGGVTPRVKITGPVGNTFTLTQSGITDLVTSGGAGCGTARVSFGPTVSATLTIPPGGVLFIGGGTPLVPGYISLTETITSEPTTTATQVNNIPCPASGTITRIAFNTTTNPITLVTDNGGVTPSLSVTGTPGATFQLTQSGSTDLTRLGGAGCGTTRLVIPPGTGSVLTIPPSGVYTVGGGDALVPGYVQLTISIAGQPSLTATQTNDIACTGGGGSITGIRMVNSDNSPAVSPFTSLSQNGGVTPKIEVTGTPGTPFALVQSGLTDWVDFGGAGCGSARVVTGGSAAGSYTIPPSGVFYIGGGAPLIPGYLQLQTEVFGGAGTTNQVLDIPC